MSSAALLLVSAVFVQSCSPSVLAETSLRDRYFLVVWSYEGAGNLPRDSHTFASFYDGDDLAVGRAVPATISWLPEDGNVRPFAIRKGRNFSLSQTLSMACRDSKRVAALGPYEITLELYQRALARIRLLDSGKVAYSELGLRLGAMNCIKAAADLTGSPFHPGPVWGSAASRAVVRHLSPFIKHRQKANKAVARLVRLYECR